MLHPPQEQAGQGNQGCNASECSADQRPTDESARRIASRYRAYRQRHDSLTILVENPDQLLPAVLCRKDALTTKKTAQLGGYVATVQKIVFQYLTHPYSKDHQV
jgi:hypothetical protein